MSEPTEVWKPVPGYDGVQASDAGRVMVKGRIKRLGNDGNGYLRVCFSGRSHHVHRLVMEAFFGSCPQDCEVNHMNGDKGDARLENLEYCSHKENMLHAHRTGLCDRTRQSARKWMLEMKLRGLVPKGETHGMAKLNEADVRQIKSLINNGLNNVQIANQFGVTKTTIRRIRIGHTWKHVA